MTNPIALDLLKLAEHYLSALHGSVARHDNIGLNLSCGGCALRDEIRDVLPKLAAAVSVPPPAPRADDRTAVLREAAAAIEAEQAREEATEWAQYGELDHETEVQGGAVRHSAGLLRRLAAEAQRAKPDRCPHGCDISTCPCLACEADEEQQPEGPCVAGEQQNETQEATLAAALDGLHTLIATSSRDWGQYRVDAWLWAVLCGWDCEEGHEHDELCDDGAAMREMAEQHGWDNDTVAKARRYRSAVRAVALAAKPRP